MYICPVMNCVRGGAVSLYSCKIVDKEILHIVSNTGIYYSIDAVGAVYPVQCTLEYSTVNINALCNSCEGVACCLSECILMFLYAGDNIHYEIEQFVLCSVHFTLHTTP